MEFSDRELKEIKNALEYLHNADLSNYGEENIKILEELMSKLNIEYISQLD